MLKKRYIVVMLGIASVLVVSLFNLALAGDVTPSGKPEPKPTDVNVLNFPLDEQGNLKATTVEGRPFPEVLALRGALVKTSYPPYYETLLLDGDIPFPIVDDFFGTSRGLGTWVLYNETFVHQMYPQQQYKIQGDVTLSLHFRIQFPQGGTNYYRGTLYFQKMLPNNTETILASATITQQEITDSGLHDIYGGASLNFETPITLNKDERIGVRVYVETSNPSSTAHFWHFCRANTNDFIIIIPTIA